MYWMKAIWALWETKILSQDDLILAQPISQKVITKCLAVVTVIYPLKKCIKGA